MYKISECKDGKIEPGQFKREFQGKQFRNQEYMMFWFLWGDYTFDIREVRKYFKRKPELKSVDCNLNLHPCTKFSKQMNQIEKLVGDKDFEKILLECAKNAKY